ncbi:hypothetical protein Acr_16g0000360 [Actinidia rufa]|uniref:Uncharacterized protein n=1 Tax=Actinidia rufa TaxID=165716 RepID=A0A7J0FXJ1_9ERIC|nr:hypothetical protein Acr_16g0000360 [Actinidia rufa]
MTSLIVIEVLAEHEVGGINHLVCAPNEKEVLYQNLDNLARPLKQKATRTEEGKGHLAEMTKCPEAEINPLPKRSKIWTSVLMSSTSSKANKYIAAEELTETKQKRRGRDDHKKKELDSKYVAKTMRLGQDQERRINDRHPRTPPQCLELILSPLNAPIAQVLTEIKHKEFFKWLEKIKNDPRKMNKNKYCEFY